MLTPKALPEGAATLATLTLRDRARRPVRGATLQIEGFMSHPGMAPLIATVAERSDGVYEADVRFTMAGDWILLVTGRLPDGRKIERRLDVQNARPGG
jgi:predicted hotdog family 3-hydroxylacyl-ACP dehydratase